MGLGRPMGLPKRNMKIFRKSGLLEMKGIRGCVATTCSRPSEGVLMRDARRNRSYAANPKAADTKCTWLLMSPLVVPVLAPS